VVLARARVLLPAVKGLQEEAIRLAGGGEAMLRYRVGTTNGPFAGGLVQRLADAHPQAQVTPTTSWSAEELAGQVVAGRLDYAVVGVCGDSTPASGAGLAWRTVSVDAVCVLISDRHPCAGRAEVALAELADERWANAPGDGCFSDCFATACARAGFTPRPVLETDVGACVDLVAAGAAAVLCQGAFREIAGVAMVPIAGTPLTWRHLLGWRPDTAAAAGAGDVLAHATAAYLETVGRRTRYAAWLRDHPEFGAQQPLPDIAPLGSPGPT